MSIAIDTADDYEPLGFPELTLLGKHIEVLRIGRGLSKQHLARYAGTSRQQLWRVMTGKSELTGALRLRLAEALRVPPSVLEANSAATSTTTTSGIPQAIDFEPSGEAAADPPAVDSYLLRPDCVERTLRTLPNDEQGRELKRTVLNVLEDLAIKRRIALPIEFFELRRRVIAGEL